MVVRAQGRAWTWTLHARTFGLGCLQSIESIFVVYSKFIFVREDLRKIQSLYGIMTGSSAGIFNPKSL